MPQLDDIIAAALDLSAKVKVLKDMQSQKQTLQDDLGTVNTAIDAQQISVAAAKAILKALL